MPLSRPLRPLPAVLAVLVAGCAPTGPLVRDAPEAEAAGYPDHSVETILAQVAASVAPVVSVAADGDLRVTQPDGSDQGASFSLRTRLSDSTTVVVRGPLGIGVARALVTPDSVFVANQLQDEFLLGPLSAADRFVPGASEDARVIRAALGLLVPEAGVAWSRTATDGRYQLSGRLPGGGSRAYTVDPAIWRVVRVVEFGADGRQAGVQEASAFDTVDGVVLPRRVRLEGAGTTVELEHRRLLVNPPDLRLRFERPDGYEVIRVE